MEKLPTSCTPSCRAALLRVLGEEAAGTEGAPGGEARPQAWPRSLLASWFPALGSPAAAAVTQTALAALRAPEPPWAASGAWGAGDSERLSRGLDALLSTARAASPRPPLGFVCECLARLGSAVVEPPVEEDGGSGDALPLSAAAALASALGAKLSDALLAEAAAPPPPPAVSPVGGKRSRRAWRPPGVVSVWLLPSLLTESVDADAAAATLALLALSLEPAAALRLGASLFAALSDAATNHELPRGTRPRVFALAAAAAAAGPWLRGWAEEAAAAAAASGATTDSQLDALFCASGGFTHGELGCVVLDEGDEPPHRDDGTTERDAPAAAGPGGVATAAADAGDARPGGSHAHAAAVFAAFQLPPHASPASSSHPLPVWWPSISGPRGAGAAAAALRCLRRDAEACTAHKAALLRHMLACPHAAPIVRAWLARVLARNEGFARAAQPRGLDPPRRLVSLLHTLLAAAMILPPRDDEDSGGGADSADDTRSDGAGAADVRAQWPADDPAAPLKAWTAHLVIAGAAAAAADCSATGRADAVDAALRVPDVSSPTDFRLPPPDEALLTAARAPRVAIAQLHSPQTGAHAATADAPPHDAKGAAGHGGYGDDSSASLCLTAALLLWSRGGGAALRGASFARRAARAAAAEAAMAAGARGGGGGSIAEQRARDHPSATAAARLATARTAAVGEPGAAAKRVRLLAAFCASLLLPPLSPPPPVPSATHSPSCPDPPEAAVEVMCEAMACLRRDFFAPLDALFGGARGFETDSPRSDFASLPLPPPPDARLATVAAAMATHAGGRYVANPGCQEAVLEALAAASEHSPCRAHLAACPLASGNALLSSLTDVIVHGAGGGGGGGAQSSSLAAQPPPPHQASASPAVAAAPSSSSVGLVPAAVALLRLTSPEALSGRYPFPAASVRLLAAASPALVESLLARLSASATELAAARTAAEAAARESEARPSSSRRAAASAAARAAASSREFVAKMLAQLLARLAAAHPPCILGRPPLSGGGGRGGSGGGGGGGETLRRTAEACLFLCGHGLAREAASILLPLHGASHDVVEHALAAASTPTALASLGASSPAAAALASRAAAVAAEADDAARVRPANGGGGAPHDGATWQAQGSPRGARGGGSGGGGGGVCAVCLEPGGSPLPRCGHALHAECLARWRSACVGPVACPVCKRPVD